MATADRVDVRPIGGPTSWRGAAVANEGWWRYQLDDAQAAALISLLPQLVAIREGDGVPALRTAPLPALDELLADVRRQLLSGAGFALLRGIPTEELTEADLETLLLTIGTRLGIPIPQNPAADMIIHVRDQGKDYFHPKVRAYETAAELEYHSDSSDVVGLLCVRPAMEGGVSTIVSSVAIHDEMVARRPDLAALLYADMWHANPIDDRVVPRPTWVRAGDRLFSHYGRRYIELAHAQTERVAPLTSEQIAALDLFDELSHSPEFMLDMDFRPGDLQLLNNYVIMHSRTGYVDWPEFERRRHLCRLWVVMPHDIKVPEEFGDIGFVPRSVALQMA